MFLTVNTFLDSLIQIVTPLLNAYSNSLIYAFVICFFFLYTCKVKYSMLFILTITYKSTYICGACEYIFIYPTIWNLI